ncbi:hypothetical protein [Williamsia sterculiae]|nr:hypothetical protein [Williamsia sterculiae]
MGAIAFRQPISEFISDIIELSGFGVSARRGDRRVEKMRNAIDSRSVDLPSPQSRENGEKGAVGASSKSISALSLIRFQGSVSRHRLTELANECVTASEPAATRLLVISAYQELVVFVRTVELVEHAESSSTLPRYTGALAYKSLAKFGGPASLADSLADLQRFKKRVADSEEAVSAQGAHTYIFTALEVLVRIQAWYTNEEPGPVVMKQPLNWGGSSADRS